MKNIKNIIKAFGLATFVGVTVTSCDLDLLPLNEVVLENYWTNRDDVDNVLRSCYTGMQSSDWLERAIVWGEVRSDNVATGQTNNTTINYINKGNLKQTNAYCNWSSFYTVINRCNTVIYYAPEVAEKDPNFTNSDLAVTIAEAKIVDTSRLSADVVQILSTVEMTNLANKAKMKYTIVSENEADLRAGKISIKTPIAQGLLNKKVGDEVDIQIPRGTIRLRIDKISV